MYLSYQFVTTHSVFLLNAYFEYQTDYMEINAREIRVIKNGQANPDTLAKHGIQDTWREKTSNNKKTKQNTED